MSTFIFELKNIAIFVGISFILALILLVVVYVLSFTSKIDFEKSSAYECGFQPFSEANYPFEVQFALIAILFLLFDIEILYLYPLGTSILQLQTIELFYILLFFIIVALGLLYEISRHVVEFFNENQDTRIGFTSTKSLNNYTWSAGYFCVLPQDSHLLLVIVTFLIVVLIKKYMASTIQFYFKYLFVKMALLFIKPFFHLIFVIFVIVTLRVLFINIVLADEDPTFYEHEYDPKTGVWVYRNGKDQLLQLPPEDQTHAILFQNKDEYDLFWHPSIEVSRIVDHIEMLQANNATYIYELHYYVKNIIPEGYWAENQSQILDESFSLVNQYLARLDSIFIPRPGKILDIYLFEAVFKSAVIAYNHAHAVGKADDVILFYQLFSHALNKANENWVEILDQI